MSMTLQLVSKEDKSVLSQLIQLYNYDFSIYTDEDLNRHGFYPFGRLDSYFLEPDRFAYFILEQGNLAGFVLVNSYCEFLGDKGDHAIAEFFVMQKYRRKGIGSKAAMQVFDLHPGRWEVDQMHNNIPAQKFWRKVIAEYTHGNYSAHQIEDEKFSIVGFHFEHAKAE